MNKHKNAIKKMKWLKKYCKNNGCSNCIFRTGEVNGNLEYGCGLVAGLSDHRRCKTILKRANDWLKEKNDEM